MIKENIGWLATTLSSIGTVLIAFLTFRLQKKVKEDTDKAKQEEYSRHASDIYYFLNDIIYKIIDNKDNDSFSKIMVDGKEYMHDINFIRYKIITNDEFKVLREVYVLYDEIKRNTSSSKEDYNKLYKLVIDGNLKDIDIEKYRHDNMIDSVVSKDIKNILNKLEDLMNNKSIY